MNRAIFNLGLHVRVAWRRVFASVSSTGPAGREELGRVRASWRELEREGGTNKETLGGQHDTDDITCPLSRQCFITSHRIGGARAQIT